MRVLAVTNLFPNPYQPNRSTFNAQQFQALAARHPMAVISPIAWTEELAARRKGGRRMPRERRIMHGDILVEHPIYCFPPKILRGSYGRFFQWSIQRTFRHLVEEFQPDVVLGSWVYPDGWAAMNLARRFDLPVVVKVHGSDILTLVKPGSSRQRLTADVVCNADGVIAVSRDLADKVVELGAPADRVRLIYNGVDTGLFQPSDRIAARAKLGIEPNAPMVLFIGNLAQVKGLDTLINACGLLKQWGSSFEAYLVGEGPMRPLLAKQALARGVEGQIKMVGTKPHRELPDWFAAADVFVLPSYSEGVPNVLLEACACGTPYVASRVGGIPEIASLGESQLVPPGDAQLLASAIRDKIQPVATLSRPMQQKNFRGHEDAAREIAELLQTVVAHHSSRRVARRPALSRQLEHFS